MKEQLVSIRETAARLGVHPDSVRNLIGRNHMKATRILGRVLVAESEIERIIRQGAGDGRKRRVRPVAGRP